MVQCETCSRGPCSFRKIEHMHWLNTAERIKTRRDDAYSHCGQRLQALRTKTQDPTSAAGGIFTTSEDQMTQAWVWEVFREIKRCGLILNAASSQSSHQSFSLLCVFTETIRWTVNHSIVRLLNDQRIRSKHNFSLQWSPGTRMFNPKLSEAEHSLTGYEPVRCWTISSPSCVNRWIVFPPGAAALKGSPGFWCMSTTL